MMVKLYEFGTWKEMIERCKVCTQW